MNFAELGKYIQAHVYELSDFWLVKCVGALFIAIVFNLHAQLLLAFTGLVIVDLISKWIALSRQYLIKSRRRKNPSFWACVLNMYNAREARYIKSSEIKHRFLGKIIVYILVVFAGGVIDLMMQVLQKPTWAVVLLVGYLSIAELISVVENLQDAGVEEAARLHEILEKKMEGLKK